MKRNCFLFCILLLLALPVMASKIDYSRLLQKGVTFTGRTLTNSDGSVSYDWVGVYLQTDFTGSSIAIEVSESNTSYHNLYIDGKFVRCLKFSGKEPQRILLAENLSKKVHRLRLQKITEGYNGCTTIHGFYLPKGGKLEPVAPKKRFIEVFGDSYTCGYGTEASGPKEHFKLETEDFDHSFGCLIARYFDADYAVEAHSGMGMVRNYGDKNQTSKTNLFTRHTQVFDDHDSIAYDFKAYKPDIVLIQLGTNDFSRNNTPTPEQYVGNYEKMIKSLRSHYGNIPILCILPYSAGTYLQSTFQVLRDSMAYDKDVHIAEPMLKIISMKEDLGADFHPNIQGQQKIAMKLIPQISTITGWKLEDKVIK